MSFEFYMRIKYFIKSTIFYIFFSKSFSSYCRTARIIEPERIFGSQYMNLKKNVYIAYKALLYAVKQDGINPEITFGEGTYIGRFFHMVGLRSIDIGKEVIIADKVFISDNIHGFEDVTMPVKAQKLIFRGDVKIGDGSWIGENVCIVGAKIGKHCVIGANSVVLKDIPDYSVAVGTPAKVIRTLTLERL